MISLTKYSQCIFGKLGVTLILHAVSDISNVSILKIFKTVCAELAPLNLSALFKYRKKLELNNLSEGKYRDKMWLKSASKILVDSTVWKSVRIFTNRWSILLKCLPDSLFNEPRFETESSAKMKVKRNRTRCYFCIRPELHSCWNTCSWKSIFKCCLNFSIIFLGTFWWFLPIGWESLEDYRCIKIANYCHRRI